jgi:hypothetical protein
MVRKAIIGFRYFPGLLITRRPLLGRQGMFNTNQIKKQMEIVGVDGVHVGTVDNVEGHRLNLTKPDTGQRSHPNRQHYLDTGLIEGVEGNQVRLSAKGNVTTKFTETAADAGRDTESLATPSWNWNKIGFGAAAVGVAAAGAAGAAYLNRKSHEDDFEFRLETDENVRLISSEKVEGTSVFGPDGERLGEIKSFMVDKYTGRVAYAVMSFGATMGFGASFFPLPWPLLEYDVEKDGYAIDLTKEQLAKAPRFDGRPEAEFTAAYRRKIILFYRS